MMQSALALDASTVLAAAIGGVVGSGGIVLVGYKALVESLRRTFATKDFARETSSRCAAEQAELARTRAIAYQAKEIAERVALVQEERWQRIEEHVVKPLEALTLRIERIAEIQAVQANEIMRVLEALKETTR